MQKILPVVALLLAPAFTVTLKEKIAIANNPR